jgi:hypothetical protein
VGVGEGEGAGGSALAPPEALGDAEALGVLLGVLLADGEPLAEAPKESEDVGEGVPEAVCEAVGEGVPLGVGGAESLPVGEGVREGVSLAVPVEDAVLDADAPEGDAEGVVDAEEEGRVEGVAENTHTGFATARTLSSTPLLVN